MSRRHLLVTNDFPPKIGGIQNYLWELWRRLDPDLVAVYTTPYEGAADFDQEQAFPVVRSREPVLLPYPWLASRIDEQANQCGAELVLLDPALPLGLVGPRLTHPYGVILHGAEAAIPARLPGLRSLLRHVLRDARLVVSAGSYALRESEQAIGHGLPSVVVPPGVDSERFQPAPSAGDRFEARLGFGLAENDVAIAVVTRLVPRKGIDRLVDAVAGARDRLGGVAPVLLIGGNGRDRRRIERRLESTGVDGRLLGRVDDATVARVYQAADVMAMPCQQRWWGIEQEGFGIVFLEAAASGCPQIAGASGGAAEAVVHGRTGLVIDPPNDEEALIEAIVELVTDGARRQRFGAAARRRAVEQFDYDDLAASLQRAIDQADLPRPGHNR